MTPSAASSDGRLRLATRGSALALAQSRLVADGLRAAWPGLEVELVTVVTLGDRRRDVTAAALGGKGVFTAAVQEAVLDGRADLAVHSAKDLPAAQTPGLALAAVPERADPRDALVARDRGLPDLDGLAAGARVGTGSPRRVALLRWLRPDLEVVPLRGNVDSRVRRALGGELDAVVLAAAGLDRLGLAGRTRPTGAPPWGSPDPSRSTGAPPWGSPDPSRSTGAPPWGSPDPSTIPLDPEAFVPAPGQGCLAVEARADDDRALGLLGALTHRPSRVALRGERAFLRRLGGSCTLPAGALVTPARRGTPLGFPGPLRAGDALEIHGFLSGLDGKDQVRERLRGPAGDPEGLGEALADRLLDACGPTVRALVEASRR